MSPFLHHLTQGTNFSSLALQSIKLQAKSYMQALEFSVMAAQHGFNIAEDALAFADLMDSCNEIERQEYLRGMFDIALLGENNAKAAHERFRNVRVKLLQVCIRVSPSNLLIDGIPPSLLGMQGRNKMVKK